MLARYSPRQISNPSLCNIAVLEDPGFKSLELLDTVWLRHNLRSSLHIPIANFPFLS